MADESAEGGWLTPELAIGIRRVQGVKWLGRKIGGWWDGAIAGLLLGGGLRRSEVIGLTLEQLQLQEGR